MNLGIVRINDLARELGVKAKAIIDLLPLFGVTEKKTHSSSIPEDVAEKIRQQLLGLMPAEGRPDLTADAREQVGELDRSRNIHSVDLTKSEIRRSLLESPFIQPPRSDNAALPTRRAALAAANEIIDITLPRKFTFNRGFTDFDYVFDHFDWSLKNSQVRVDLTTC
jgi:hypothetical protein